MTYLMRLRWAVTTKIGLKYGFRYVPGKDKKKSEGLNLHFFLYSNVNYYSWFFTDLNYESGVSLDYIRYLLPDI